MTAPLLAGLAGELGLPEPAGLDVMEAAALLNKLNGAKTDVAIAHALGKLPPADSAALAIEMGTLYHDVRPVFLRRFFEARAAR